MKTQASLSQCHLVQESWGWGGGGQGSEINAGEAHREGRGSLLLCFHLKGQEHLPPPSFLLVYVSYFKGLVFMCPCLSVPAYTFVCLCVSIGVLLSVYTMQIGLCECA